MFQIIIRRKKNLIFINYTMDAQTDANDILVLLARMHQKLFNGLNKKGQQLVAVLVPGNLSGITMLSQQIRKKKREQSTAARIITVGVLLLLALLIAVAGFRLYLSLFVYTRVPDLTGLDEATAVKMV